MALLRVVITLIDAILKPFSEIPKILKCCLKFVESPKIDRKFPKKILKFD